MSQDYMKALQDGEITELADFVMKAAEVFDGPLEESAPDVLDHDKAIALAAWETESLNGMTADVAEAGAKFAHMQAVALSKSQRWLNTARRKHCQDMTDKVRNWSPPPTQSKIRTFLLRQLWKAMETDCPDPNQRFPEPEPALLTGEAWRAKRLLELAETIAHHRKAIAEEITRAEARNKWIRELRASLYPVAGK